MRDFLRVEVGWLNSEVKFKTTVKFRKEAPGLIFFKGPLRGLFLEGLIFGGAYLPREICVSNSIGLAL